MAEPTKDISQLFAERTPIDDALRRSLWTVVRQHQQTGLPMVICENGEIVWISADEAARRLEEDEKKRQTAPGEGESS